MTEPVPPAWTYWVDCPRFLAGCFPGAPDLDGTRVRLQQLMDVGVRKFVNLMQTTERYHSGQLFTDYVPVVTELAEAMGVAVTCHRFPIPDLGVPSTALMEEILHAIDAGMVQGGVYVQCWGGVGRTGTVVGCWLLRHGHATPETVLEHLAGLRKMDRRAGHRRSPETRTQERFVQEWKRP